MSIIKISQSQSESSCLQLLRKFKAPSLSPGELKIMRIGRVAGKNPTAYHAPTMNQIMRDLGLVYHPEFALALVLGCLPQMAFIRPKFLLQNVEFCKQSMKLVLHRPTYSDICDRFKQASNKYLSIVETLCVRESFSHGDELKQIHQDRTLLKKLETQLLYCSLAYKEVQESIPDTHAEDIPASSVRDVVQQLEEIRF